MENTLRSILLKIIYVIFVLYMGITLISIVISDIFQFGRVEWLNNIFSNDTLHLIIMLIFSLVIWILYKRKEDREIKIGKKIFAFQAVLFLFQLFLIYNIWFETGWDIVCPYYDAIHRVEEGTLLGQHIYFTANPNNVMITAVFAWIDYFFYITGIRRYYLMLIIVGALMMNISGLFIYGCVKKMYNEKRAIVVWIVWAIFFGLSPWICVPYTDMYTIIYPSMIFYLFLCTDTKKWTRYLYWMLIGLFSIVGYFIKPTASIILIAIVLYEFIEFISRKVNYKKVLVGALALAVGCFMGVMINKLAIAYMGFEPNEEKAVVWSHFLMLGQNDETLGAYDGDDVQYTATFLSKKEKIAANLDKARERVANRGFWGNVKFYTKKNLNTYDDGTFCWCSEGSFFVDIKGQNNAIGKFLKNIYYDDGKYYHIFTAFYQGIWLLIILGCCFWTREKEGKGKILITISIIGISLFVLLFERRSRYLFTYIPLYVVAGVNGLINVFNVLSNRLSELRKSK